MRANIIQVDNKLPVDVYCVPGFEYPDTSLFFTNKSKILANPYTLSLAALNSKQLFRLDLCNINTWNSRVKSDTLQVFVFDQQMIQEKSWEEIVEGSLYIRRLVFTHKEIIANNCRIVIE